MATSLDEAAQLPHDGTCDACEPDEAREAVQICDDCGFSYCGLHSEGHMERFPEHRVRPFSSEPPDGEQIVDSEVEEESKGKENEYCDKKRCLTHKQELSLYCREDQKIICVLCAVTGDHRGHQLITLNEAFLELKNKKPVDLKLAMADMVERLKVKLADPKINRSEMKGFVQKEFEHMRQLVAEEEHRALHYVDLQEAVASAHVTEALAELNVHLIKLMAEMTEVTRQLNSFNEMVDEKPENTEDACREDKSPDPTAGAGSSSRFHSLPPGNGPW
ncbi:tripartite motif-containing protein 44 isoform 1-T1 [Rhinophrynus dorsalis]